MVNPYPLFKQALGAVLGKQNRDMAPHRASGLRNRLLQAPAGSSGESKLPLPQNHLVNLVGKGKGKKEGRKEEKNPVGRDSSRKGRPLPTRSAPGEPPHGEREEGSPRRGRPPHTHTPSRLAEQDRRAGSLPSHAEQKAAGAWLCRLRPRCAVRVGVGRENLVLGEKGTPLQPEEQQCRAGILDAGHPSPDSWTERGLGSAPRPEEGEPRLPRKGALGSGRGGKCSGKSGSGYPRH